MSLVTRLRYLSTVENRIFVLLDLVYVLSGMTYKNAWHDALIVA